MKQFSLIEIISIAVPLAIVVVDLLESSMLLTQLHFNLPPGAHLLLMEHQLCQLHFQQLSLLAGFCMSVMPCRIMGHC